MRQLHGRHELCTLLSELSTYFHETWWVVYAWPRDESVTFWGWSAFRSRIFSLYLWHCEVPVGMYSVWLPRVVYLSQIDLHEKPRFLLISLISKLCNSLTLQTEIYSLSEAYTWLQSQFALHSSQLSMPLLVRWLQILIVMDTCRLCGRWSNIGGIKGPIYVPLKDMQKHFSRFSYCRLRSSAVNTAWSYRQAHVLAIVPLLLPMRDSETVWQYICDSRIWALGSFDHRQ